MVVKLTKSVHWLQKLAIPRTHGSGLFTRGQTQALSVAYYSTHIEEQRIDGLSGDAPNVSCTTTTSQYSVGSTGRYGPWPS